MDKLSCSKDCVIISGNNKTLAQEKIKYLKEKLGVKRFKQLDEIQKSVHSAQSTGEVSTGN